MISVVIDDKKGSSFRTIHQRILEKYPRMETRNKSKHAITSAIKQGVREERFVKIRNNFKINSSWTRIKKANEVKKMKR